MVSAPRWKHVLRTTLFATLAGLGAGIAVSLLTRYLASRFLGAQGLWDWSGFLPQALMFGAIGLGLGLLLGLTTRVPQKMPSLEEEVEQRLAASQRASEQESPEAKE